MEETLRKRKPEEELEEEGEREIQKKLRLSGGEVGDEEEGVPNNDSLLSIARYSDDEEEEEERLRSEQNGHRREEEEEEEEDGDHVARARAPVRRRRQVELRRDCPYLDTVNRQVIWLLNYLS